MTQLIDGKAIAADLRKKIAELVTTLPSQPGLAVVLVGENPASQVYVRNKHRAAHEVGFYSAQHQLPADVSQAELLSLIATLNADPLIHGILVQLPLPDQIDARQVLQTIDPRKDVDGFHPLNVGYLQAGLPALVPCTPLGCLILLRASLPQLAGQHAVVLGRSNIVGKPMAQLLLGADCTVTMAHSKTPALPALCRQADILVAAVGRPQLVTADWVKPGATVIDVGINRLTNGQLVGDVDFAQVAPIARAITPVPGGVGPMTIACLLRNTLQAYAAAQSLNLALPG